MFQNLRQIGVKQTYCLSWEECLENRTPASSAPTRTSCQTIGTHSWVFTAVTHSCSDSPQVSPAVLQERSVGWGWQLHTPHTLPWGDRRSSDLSPTCLLSEGRLRHGWVLFSLRHAALSGCSSCCCSREWKSELEGMKDSSGSWSHLHWLIHELIASHSLQPSALPHAASYPNVIPDMAVPQHPETTPTAQCHPCPHSLFSLVSALTAPFLTAAALMIS